MPGGNATSTPKGERSLEQHSPFSFELHLLELAFRGKNAFNAWWKKNGENNDIFKERMCQEILREIEVWERDGNLKLLEARARKLTVGLKYTNVHQRAKVVYLDFLGLGRTTPRQSLDPVAFEFHKRDSERFKVPERVSLRGPLCDRPHVSTQSPKNIEIVDIEVPSILEEKFEQMLSIELPFSSDEDSATSPKWGTQKLPTSPVDSGTQKLQGEPSACSSSVDLLSREALSIFNKPLETDEGASKSPPPRRDTIRIPETPGNNEFACTQAPSPSDKDLERMIGIELPLSNDEDSFTPSKVTQKQQGEPSTFEHGSLIDTLSNDLLDIFEKPSEANEGYKTCCGHDEITFDISSPGISSPGISSPGTACEEDSVILLGNYDKMKHSKERESLVDDFKTEPSDNQWNLTVKLGSFPGKDFQEPIEWTVDNTIFKANNIADLRSKHDVLIEGAFRKRCRTKRWRDYYGFFLCTGVMIYFRNEVYKKVADFRKSTVIIQKSKPYRLTVEDVYVDTEQTHWPLQFSSAKHFNTWYETITRFSKGERKKGTKERLSLDFPSP